jgi:hypothetical protein
MVVGWRGVFFKHWLLVDRRVWWNDKHIAEAPQTKAGDVAVNMSIPWAILSELGYLLVAIPTE